MTVISEIQKYLGLYGLSLLIILGNIGNMFTIIIFIRNLKKHMNSCTIYLLATSIVNWVLINTAVISSVYAINYTDPKNTSIAVCKLRLYGTQILLMLSRSFMISACIDRWALTSPNVRIRSIARPQIARYVIIGLIIIWPIIPVHMAVFVTITSGNCAAPSYYALAYSIYLFIFIGILPPALMITFGVLAWKNLKQVRSRVAPTNDPVRLRLHRADRDLMKMLAGEVMVYIITTCVFPINMLYGFITAPFAQYKSPMRLEIEGFISFIISPLLNFVYCVAPFYIYTICSKKFRIDFIQLFRRQSQG